MMRTLGFLCRKYNPLTGGEHLQGVRYLGVKGGKCPPGIDSSRAT